MHAHINAVSIHVDVLYLQSVHTFSALNMGVCVLCVYVCVCVCCVCMCVCMCGSDNILFLGT